MRLFWQDRFMVRHSETERTFAGLGLSKRAAGALIRAGVTGPKTLTGTPWTDEDAGARFTSLKWRLSVDPHGGPKTVSEVERVRNGLLKAQGGAPQL